MAPHACFRTAATARALLLAAGVVVVFDCGAGCGNSSAAHDGGDGARDDASLSDGLFPLDAGLAGYALSFDGINDYATAGNSGFPAASAPQTESMWVNYDSTAAMQDFLVMRTGFMSGVQIGIRDGTVAVWRTLVSRTLVSAPTPPVAGKWHHVAYTFDRTTHMLYIDGVMVATSTTAGDIRTPDQVWLGTVDGTAELYKGLMDEVRIWSLVRSAADIQKDMLHRPPTGETGLVTYWTFDDVQSGGRSLDTTGSGNAVTLGDGIAERMPSRVFSDAPVGP